MPKRLKATDGMELLNLGRPPAVARTTIQRHPILSRFQRKGGGAEILGHLLTAVRGEVPLLKTFTHSIRIKGWCSSGYHSMKTRRNSRRCGQQRHLLAASPGSDGSLVTLFNIKERPLTIC